MMAMMLPSGSLNHAAFGAPEGPVVAHAAFPAPSSLYYGLAFLLLKRGDLAEAAAHLEAFLEAPPAGAEADRWVRHARQTLDELRAAPADYPEQQPEG